MKTKTLVSIILPTFNEAKSILLVIEKIKKVFSSLSNVHLSEIIMVDDNSSDLTGEIVKKKYKNSKQIKVFVRKKERGLGTAIGYGIKKAKGEIIIGMDADGNHPPEKISLILEELRNNDLVVASRFIKGGGVEKVTDQFRHLGSFTFNFILKKILGFPVLDNTSGFYGIKKNKLQALNLDKIYYGYGDYHLRLVYFAKKKKYSIKEISCVYKKRIAGQSKSKLFKMFFDYLKEALKLKLNLIK